MPASFERPRMPPLSLPPQAALFLDVDGTLLEFAPAPHLVVVPPDLAGVLRRLRGQLQGALAVVTGRPIEQVDGLFGDAPYAVAGEHGAAIRVAPGAAIHHVALPALAPEWLTQAEEVVQAHPGALLEPKSRGFVFHYRNAPELGPVLHEAAQRIVAGREAEYRLLPAHMAWEVKPSAADKGTAVAALMAEPPFRGRVPVYVGDDVTDEDGMRVAREAGGLGLRVAEAFGDPEGVRIWLRGLAK